MASLIFYPFLRKRQGLYICTFILRSILTVLKHSGFLGFPETFFKNLISLTHFEIVFCWLSQILMLEKDFLKTFVQAKILENFIKRNFKKNKF